MFKKKICCIILAYIVICNTCPAVCDVYRSQLLDMIQAASERRSESFSGSQAMYSSAGESSVTDWYAFIDGFMGRDTGGYRAALNSFVGKWYTGGRLDRSSATDWARMGLCAMSCGFSPVFEDNDTGSVIDIVYDGTEGRSAIAVDDVLYPNALAFMIILADAANSFDDEQNVSDGFIQDKIDELLECELEGGGFCLMGSAADTDVTAMCIQALAPHRDTDGVSECIDRGLDILSSMQNESGGYATMGTSNCESCAQVIIALTALGIDPQEDERFIKNGNSVLDVMLSFRQDDGGFAHAEASVMKSNELATVQACLAMIAVYKLYTDGSRLYDMSKAHVGEPESTVSADIETVPATGTETESEAFPAPVTEDHKITEIINEEPTAELAESIPGEDGLTPVPGEQKQDSTIVVMIVSGLCVVIIVVLIAYIRRRSVEKK